MFLVDGLLPRMLLRDVNLQTRSTINPHSTRKGDNLDWYVEMSEESALFNYLRPNDFFSCFDLSFRSVRPREEAWKSFEVTRKGQRIVPLGRFLESVYPLFYLSGIFVLATFGRTCLKKRLRYSPYFSDAFKKALWRLFSKRPRSRENPSSCTSTKV